MCLKTREYRGVPVAPPEPELVGIGGLVLLRYTGLSTVDENINYPGLATKTKYKFGLDKSRGFVDKQDVLGFLSCFEDGKPVFEVVK